MAAEKEKYCISHDLLGGLLSDLGAGSIAELMEKSEKEKAMRNKLAELLEEAEGLVNNDRPSLEAVAEYLIAHGVTIPERCKDCAREGTEKCPMVHRDPIFGNLYSETRPMGYCSYGERRPDEN